MNNTLRNYVSSAVAHNVTVTFDSQIINLEKVCPITKEIFSVDLDIDTLNQWITFYKDIEEMFPEFSEDQWDFIQNFLTPAEWKELAYIYDEDTRTYAFG